MGKSGNIYRVMPNDTEHEAEVESILRSFPECSDVKKESIFGATLFKVMYVLKDSPEAESRLAEIVKTIEASGKVQGVDFEDSTLIS